MKSIGDLEVSCYNRKGELMGMTPIARGYTRLEFNIPSRGLIGYRGRVYDGHQGQRDFKYHL